MLQELFTNANIICIYLCSTQVQGGGSQQQIMVSPSTLPSKPVNGLLHQHASGTEKSKSMMPLSPLANGSVTVTNQMQSQSFAQDTLSRPTKYVTRPQTPVKPKTFALSVAHLSQTNPKPMTYQQPNMNHHTMTLPNRSNHRSRTSCNNTAGDKFAIQPQPTFAYNDNDVTTWHASLPRLIRHIPAPQVRFNRFLL